jgi:cytochrome b pre-mRNA-processing protein 6
MMKPASNPNHYEDLARELEEAPDRTWWGNFVKRVRGMVRMK